MTDDPSAAPTDPLARFAWHPEPELIGYGDAGARAAMERLGADTWATALDFLYDQAAHRAMGDPSPYAALAGVVLRRDPAARRRPRPRPRPIADILAEFRDRLAGGQMNAQHPRQFGYFTPPPLPVSMMGELLAQMTNQGVDVWHAGPLATFVEEEVVRWLCDLIGYGSRVVRAADVGRRHGQLHGHDPRPRHPPRAAARGRPGAAGLACSRTSGSTPRTRPTSRSPGRSTSSGFPPETLVVIPSDERFRLRGAPVAEAVARDRAAGLKPFAIAAVAGSTNTGSVDLVGELADVAAAEDLWLHVDAAYGGGARLSERDRDRVRDLERADSVTVDPHKWFFQAYDIGGLLVRDGAHLGQTFGGRAPEYYRGGETPAAGTPTPHDHDEHGDQLNFYKLSFEGTRRWRALKLWMSWKHLGTEGFGRLIEANDDLAALLARRCAESDDFEAIPATPELSVVCFRHLPGGRDAALALAPDGARRPPGSAPGGPRGVRRRLADDDPVARRDLAACRDRQLPLDRGRHRPPARDAAAPAHAGDLSRRRRATASRPRSRAGGSRPHRHGPASSAGSPRHPPVRRRWPARGPRAAPRRRPG